MYQILIQIEISALTKTFIASSEFPLKHIHKNQQLLHQAERILKNNIIWCPNETKIFFEMYAMCDTNQSSSLIKVMA